MKISEPTCPLRALSLMTLCLLCLAACNLPLVQNQDLKNTQIALNVRQTLLAVANEQATQTVQAQQATLDAQATQLSLLPLTATLEAPPAQPSPPLSGESAATATPEIPPTPLAEDLRTRMQRAQILLYEDMVGQLDTNRYVKDTLDQMGLPYTDVGSAKGWLKSSLTAGAPGGGPWDLVIIAAEAKSGVSGEFFEYVNNALNMGSAVILEVWYLDQTAAGTAATLLSRCGVEFDKDWRKVPPARMVMFPLDGTHPVLNEPNSSLAFTNVTSYWAYEYDIGDWLRLAPGSNARLIIGTMPTDLAGHGTVAVCLDGQLILQTFSSHQLTFQAMRPLWENYIYNALKWRLQAAP